MKTIRYFLSSVIAIIILSPVFAFAEQPAIHTVAVKKIAPSNINNTQAKTKVNINTAGIAQLITLSGVGKQKAAAILAYRNRYGKFKSFVDLTKVKGMSKGIVERNKQRLQL